MDPLSITASVIAIVQLTESVLSTLREIKGASKDRENFTLELTNLYDLFMVLQSRLESVNDEEAWFSAMKDLNANDGPLYSFERSLKELHAKLEKQRISKIVQTLFWKIERVEIDKILDKMERLKSLVQIALASDHFKLSLAIKSRLDEAYNDNQAMNQTAETIKRSDDINQHEDLLEWISTANYPAEQFDIIRERGKHTGERFLNSPEFLHWERAAASETLYCLGIPGAGKTMASAIAIDHLSTRQLDNDNVGLAYIYCNYKKPQTDQSATKLVAAVLKQLVQSQPSKTQPVKDLREAHKRNKTRPSLDDMIETLRLTVQTFSKTFVIIDALDECPEQDRTLQKFLSSLSSIQRVANVCLMLTSRHSLEIQAEIQKLFPGLSSFEIRAEDDDISKYVDGSIEELPNCIRSNSSLQRDVKDAIVQAVDGMFLLAKLYMIALEGALRIKDVRHIIQDLQYSARDIAKAYDHAYEEAMLRIKSQESNRKELAERVLSWVVCAKRQLTITELCHAVSVSPNQQDLDEEEDLYQIEDVVSVSAGLVIVDNESSVVRLVHYTTQEFFEREWQRLLPNAQVTVTKTCLTYLCFPHLQTVHCHDLEDVDNLSDVYPLLGYAALHWGRHIVGYEQQVLVEALLFLNDPSARSVATTLVHVARLRELYGYGYSQRKSTVLHLLAEFGLVHLAKTIYPKLVDKDILEQCDEEDDDEDEDYFDARTPLEIAALRGHGEFINWMLHMYAKSNILSFRCERAFDLALRKNHKGAVEALLSMKSIVDVVDVGTALELISHIGYKDLAGLLIDKGRPWDTEDQSYGRALQTASSHGYIEIVQLLLDGVANVNTVHKDGGLALEKAAAKGHKHVVDVLISRGVDVNLVGERHSNLITAAATGGLTETMKLALRNGASIDGDAGQKGNPLIEASRHGHIEAVKWLLDNGANVNWQDRTNKTPILASVESELNYTAIVELLIDHGAFIDAPCETFGSVLAKACNRGKTKIVQLLLNKGADVMQGNDEFGNALQVASCSRRGEGLEIVKLLLATGIDVNAQDGKFGNPLQAASYTGNLATMEELLAHGAHVNAEGGLYGTAIIAASFDGGVEWEYDRDERYRSETTNIGHFAIKMLLDRGAEINSRHPKFGTALQVAARKGFEKKVKLLLDNGANINMQGGRYHTALQAAAYKGREKITQMLLDKGADVALVGGIYGSALQAAAHSGSKLIVQSLIDHGADVNLMDVCGNTALIRAAKRGNTGISRILIDNNADVGSNMKRDPNFRAAFSTNKKSAALFLELGADKTIDVLGKSLLHYFAAASDSVSTKWAISHGFDINQQDHHGWSPLHWAAHSGIGDHHLATTLVEAGADLRLQDKIGLRPVDIAVHRGSIAAPATEFLCEAMHVPKIETADVGTGRSYQFCDFCDVFFNERLHHCTTCGKYVLCYRCIHDASEIHPPHVFMQDLSYPDDISESDSYYSDFYYSDSDDSDSSDSDSSDNDSNGSDSPGSVWPEGIN